jgi:hypothetical protein
MAIDSGMSDRLGTSFFQAYRLFDSDTQTVFVDRDSHLTESAHRVVAEQIADVIEPVLRAKLPARP